MQPGWPRRGGKVGGRLGGSGAYHLERTHDRWPQLMIIPSLEPLRLESQTLGFRGTSWFRSSQRGPHALSQSRAVGRAGVHGAVLDPGRPWIHRSQAEWSRGARAARRGEPSPLGVCMQRGQGTYQGGCQGVTGQVGGREPRALPASGALALTLLHQQPRRFKREWRPQRGL